MSEDGVLEVGAEELDYGDETETAGNEETTKTRTDEENREEGEIEESAQDPFVTMEKHPLHTKWTWWFFRPGEKKAHWTENMVKVYSFGTVEDFWALFNHLQPPRLLPDNLDYYVFREGIKPMWEDPANEKGGRFLFLLNRDSDQNSIDTLWMQVLMLLIGEAFGDASELVTGAVVQIRHSMNKVAIWTRNCDDIPALCVIGEGIRKQLQLPRSMVIKFERHTDNQRSAKSRQQRTGAQPEEDSIEKHVF